MSWRDVWDPNYVERTLKDKEIVYYGTLSGMGRLEGF